MKMPLEAGWLAAARELVLQKPCANTREYRQ
jgi:hypothetical protein